MANNTEHAMANNTTPITLQAAASIDGVHTEVVSTAFSDRVFVVVTQLGKVGNLLSACVERGADGEDIYSVSTLLGRRDDPTLAVYARQLAQRMADADCRKPLLLGIALAPRKEPSPETFRAVMELVQRAQVW